VRLEQHSDKLEALILQMVEGGLYRCSQLKYVSEKNEEKLATIRQLATWHIDHQCRLQPFFGLSGTPLFHKNCYYLVEAVNVCFIKKKKKRK
jgi:hypothetical protein